MGLEFTVVILSPVVCVYTVCMYVLFTSLNLDQSQSSYSASESYPITVLFLV